jgi:ankyrin repeat protein
LDVVKFLIEMYSKYGHNDPKNDEKGNLADYLNATDEDEMTPLMRAAMEGLIKESFAAAAAHAAEKANGGVNGARP